MMYPLLELYLIDTWATVESLSLAALNQSEAHLKAGTLSLAWNLDDVPDLGKDDTVALRVKQDAGDAGTVIFSGKIASRKTSGKSVIYTASNVLADLQRIQMLVGGNSRFSLFRSSVGNPLSAGEQIKAALDYSVSQGVEVDYNQVEFDALDIILPSVEVSEITIYEVIKKAVVFCPNIVVAVEYANPNSIIRVVDREDLSTISYSAIHHVETFGATANYDRQVNGVALTFRWVDIDEELIHTRHSVTHTAGAVSGLNVLRQDVELLGTQFEASASINLHRMVPCTWQTGWCWEDDGYDDTRNVWEFWRGIAKESGLWSNCWAYIPDYDGGDDEIKAIGWPEAYSSTPPNWVVYPSDIPTDPARLSLFADANPRPFIGRCELMYDRAADKHIEIHIHESHGFYLVDSDASPLVLSGFSTPDPIPTLLSERLYNALSPLQYDGQIVRIDDFATPGRLCSILHRLNITESEGDLETMATVVQRCNMNYSTGRQTIDFGAADHLEPKDFIALCRSNKNLRLA